MNRFEEQWKVVRRGLRSGADSIVVHGALLREQALDVIAHDGLDARNPYSVSRISRARYPRVGLMSFKAADPERLKVFATN